MTNTRINIRIFTIPTYNKIICMEKKLNLNLWPFETVEHRNIQSVFHENISCQGFI